MPHAEVLYLKAQQKYVTLRTAEHSYLLDDSLAELEPRLGDTFIRIHRNALVARRAMRALELRDLPEDEAGAGGWAVRVAPVDEWLAVSRRQVSTVRAVLGDGGVSSMAIHGEVGHHTGEQWMAMRVGFQVLAVVLLLVILVLQ